jgi:hypothetical protein
MSFFDSDCESVYGYTIQLACIQHWQYASIIYRGIVFGCIDAFPIF